MNFDELKWTKRYLPLLIKLLHADTKEECWVTLRQLQELEEVSDRFKKTVFVEVKLIDRKYF